MMAVMATVNSCTSKTDQASHDQYTCPMHPTVLSDKPGSCPVCGMDLVRKARQGESVEITEDLARLIKSPNESVVATIKTMKAEFKSLRPFIQAQGIVTYDSRYVYTIPARVGGRLENVYLKYVFQPVRKGQKVADIYSPELLTAQRELLYLIENDQNNELLIASAKTKLYLLGASEKQVEEIIRRKEAVYIFSIFSPFDGYVIGDSQPSTSIDASTKPTSTSSSGMGDSGMGAKTQPVSSSISAEPSASLPREGNYVSSGQTLFKIVSTSAFRVELNLPSSQGGTAQIGNELSLDLGNGTVEMAKVDFVQPFYSEGEEFVKVRVYVRKTNDLRIGQLVNATIELKATEALWLPKAAVLDLGLEKIVFVKEREVFKPRKITSGISTNGWLEIKQGISSTDEVAMNAQYLVDSESFIKSK